MEVRDAVVLHGEAKGGEDLGMGKRESGIDDAVLSTGGTVLTGVQGHTAVHQRRIRRMRLS